MDNNIVKDKRCTPQHYFHPVSAGLILSRFTLSTNCHPGMAAPTVFDQKRPSKIEARNPNILIALNISEYSSNTKMDDLIRGKDHPSFCFKNTILFLPYLWVQYILYINGIDLNPRPHG